MVKREYSENQLKAHVLEFLRRQERWGAHYFPVDTMVNWIGKGMKRDGKQARKAIRELVRTGYVLLHKKGETISLNPRFSREIEDYILRYLV